MTNTGNTNTKNKRSQKKIEEEEEPQVIVLPREEKNEPNFDPEKVINALDGILPGKDYAKTQIITSLEKIQLSRNYQDKQGKETLLLYGNMGVGKLSTITQIAKIAEFPLVRINMESMFYDNEVVENHGKMFGNIVMSIFNGIHDKLSYENIDPKRLRAFERQYKMKIKGDESFLEPAKNAEFSIIYFENVDALLLCHTLDQTERSYAMTFQLEFAQSLKKELNFPIGEFTSANMLYVLSGKLTMNNYIFSNEKRVGFAPGAIPGSNEFKRINRKDLKELGMNESLSNCITKIIGLENINSAEFELTLKQNHSFLNKNVKLLKDSYNIDLVFDDKSIRKIAEHLEKKKENYTGIKETVDNLLSPFYLNPRKYSNQKVVVDPNMINNTLKHL